MTDHDPSGEPQPPQPPPPPHWSAPGQPPLGGPQAGPPVAGQPYGGPFHPYQPPPFIRPDAPSAMTAFVLGIVGLAGGAVLCGLPIVVSPFAWYFGNQALREIEDSGGALGGESQARAGQVMGIIGTALLALGLVVLTLILIAAASSD